MIDARPPFDDPIRDAFCKACGTEFPTGTVWCDTCGRKLVLRERAAALGAGTAGSDSMVFLQDFSAGSEAGWAASALEARGIPNRLDAVTPQFGSGVRMKARLLVAPERFEEARSLLADANAFDADGETAQDREEFSRARRVRYLRVVLGFNAAWAVFLAYLLTRRIGGAPGALGIIFASVWLIVFAVSFLKPRPAFAVAMAFGIVMLLLSVVGAWLRPEHREPFRVVLRQCTFIVFMYWGWQSAKVPAVFRSPDRLGS
jgi:hypothetical protein